MSSEVICARLYIRGAFKSQWIHGQLCKNDTVQMELLFSQKVYHFICTS